MLEPPAPAVLVEAFANTVDVEEGSDEIATPAGLAAWLEGRGLLDAPGTVPDGIHRDYLALRAGLREELGPTSATPPTPPCSPRRTGSSPGTRCGSRPTAS